jgi:hypothetical protein
MSSTTNLPELPKKTATKLVALKGKNPDEFHALIKALRNEGWPLRAIAAPLAVSRTAVMDWEKKCPQDAELPEVPEVPLPEPKDRTNISKKYFLSEGEITKLKTLADSASKVRRYTDQNATSRLDALELEKLLIEYSNRGLSRTQLARYCGVSDSAIKQRLRKHK